MATHRDGPVHSAFSSTGLGGNATWGDLGAAGVSAEMAAAADAAPRGDCVFRGLPFTLSDTPVVVTPEAGSRHLTLPAVTGKWLVFAHTSDATGPALQADGCQSPGGFGRLAEHAATYVLLYADGTERSLPVRRRHHLGAACPRWGENCVEAVTHSGPRAIAESEQSPGLWGWTQRRVTVNDRPRWIHWLWACPNPHPRKQLAGLRVVPAAGNLLLAGICWGNASENPLRWRRRRKAILRLPSGTAFDPALDEYGNLSHVALDLGAVIQSAPRPEYPADDWADGFNNQLPGMSERDILVEYAAHADAQFHLPGDRQVRVRDVEGKARTRYLTRVPAAEQRVRIRVVEKGTGNTVAAKLHLHGSAGEYLPPLHLHRLPNSSWFEDYSPEFQHQGLHRCVYIDGQTDVKLPLGTVYLEVSKGYEIRPVRRTVQINAATNEVVVEIERVLPWRARGWVTADTHVHFLSPATGVLEGAAEGVNVVNLLASQWGELMTNAGDFDGATVHTLPAGSEAGEFLLKVGTENRQHVMGHISLLGYRGPMIVPMTTGGPDEAALGDPVEVLLTEWARQCHDQGGVVVIPHFPNPRLEHAATIVEGDADAIEMTSWGSLFAGIDPYSVADWYRYLNNGYFVAAVGGTDKMSATTAVGTVRTYARLADDEPLSYDAWMAAVRRGETFVTYGPLVAFTVDGRPAGARMAMSGTGGTVDVLWEAASVALPMTRVEIIVNGEVVESAAVDAEAGAGSLSLTVDRSSWIALLIRGHQPGHPEIIAAHTSPVMIDVEGTPFCSPADALTILQQIEGALAYLDTLATRADPDTYRRMRLVLTGAHRNLHNRMHAAGVFHDHSITEDHPEHHRD